jgi:hypothetical protein
MPPGDFKMAKDPISAYQASHFNIQRNFDLIEEGDIINFREIRTGKVINMGELVILTCSDEQSNYLQTIRRCGDHDANILEHSYKTLPEMKLFDTYERINKKCHHGVGRSASSDIISYTTLDKKLKEAGM